MAVSAASPDRTFGQYTHQRWSEESDTPRPVFAIAQGPRGFLWLATAVGLFRFDGLRFEPMSSGINRVANGAPSAILVRRNGDVWTNFQRSKRFAIYRNGRLRFMPGPPAPDRVIAMREAADGSVWVLTEAIGRPLLRYHNGRWTHFWANAGAPLDNPFSLVVSKDGVVWVSFGESVARLVPATGRFQFVQHEAALGRLSIDPDGRIWLTGRSGTYPLTGAGGRGPPPPLRYPYATDPGQIRGWPAFDGEGNLWIATYYHGLERIAHPDPRGAATRAQARSSVEHFTSRDGLTSDLTSQIFEDHDGNIWAGTDGGLDRFWPAALHFEPALTNAAAFGDVLLRASDGTVYIGEAHTVYRVLPGGEPQPILRSAAEPRTLCEAPDGAIWVGTGNRVVIWRKGRLSQLPKAAPVQFTIYDCAFDANGDYWVTASFGGMARYHAGRWERMFGRASNTFVPRSMINDERRGIIVQWNDHALSWIDGRTIRSMELPFGRFKPEAVALYSVPGSLYLAGDFGLARIRSKRLEMISSRHVRRFSGINGIVQAADGITWLAAPSGILRLPTAELDHAFADSQYMPRMQVFGMFDGLRDPPHDHSRHSIVQGGDGRLWVATQGGTLWLDPSDVGRIRVPPKVWITSLVGGRVYPDPVSVDLPASVHSIQIDFSVLNFTNPRGARVLYTMEGQDGGWIDAGSRREAFYSSVGPGHYRFRVIAANQDGIWNEKGAVVEFTIAPTFFQSPGFIALCVVLAILLLWLAYRLRIMQIEGRVRRQLAVRLSERERIARELHDTLLQSVQGLILRFQTVANRMSADDASKARLEEALTRADQVYLEGRNRVQDLRIAEGAGDFAELIGQKASEAGFDPSFPVRIIVEGKPRRLHPLVSAELGRIASEALFNVARHAQACSVEITVRFSCNELGIEIRDDGIGLPEEVLEKHQKPGHFGLVGMRERAERIGGKLLIESWPGQGCAVVITVPARLAFADKTSRPFLAKLLLRTGGGHD